MTISNALAFINRGLEDSNIREQLNSTSSSEEMNQVLKKENFSFTREDFDTAFYQKLTECQETEDADQVKEFRMWWDLLFQLMNPSGAFTPCKGCGTG